MITLDETTFFNMKPPYNEINLIVNEKGKLKIYLSNGNIPQQVVIITNSIMYKKFWIESGITSLSNFEYMEHTESSADYIVLANKNNLSYIFMNNGMTNPILNFKNGYQFGMSELKQSVYNKLKEEEFISTQIKKPHSSNETMELIFNAYVCELNNKLLEIKTNCSSNFTSFSLSLDENFKNIDNQVNNKKKSKFLLENL